MGKTNYVPEMPEETLEDRMAKLYEMKTEYRAKQKAFKDANKHLLESIRSLENIITAEVIKLKRTVKVDGIRAEYKPVVVIKIKKEQNNETHID